MSVEMSTCCTCGHTWITGTDGYHSCSEHLNKKINDAITLAVQYGGIDGAHHKDWVIDQTVRILAGKRYEEIVRDACDGEDGPNTYEWSQGIAP